MNSESPHTKVKSCYSCKRRLPIYYFGIRKYSHDGYNPCCKECRNFKRNSRGDHCRDITPLNLNNFKLITFTLNKGSGDLIGLNLQTFQRSTVKFSKIESEFHIQIKHNESDSIYLKFEGTKKIYIDKCLSTLNKQNLRLFTSDDIYGLSNWGYQK